MLTGLTKADVFIEMRPLLRSSAFNRLRQDTERWNGEYPQHFFNGGSMGAAFSSDQDGGKLGGCLRWHYPHFWLRLRAPSPSSLSSWDQPGMVRTNPLIAHKQTGSESQVLRIRQPAPVTSSHCGTSRFCSRLCRLSERDYTTPTIGHALMPPWLRTPPTGHTPFHSPRSTSN